MKCPDCSITMIEESYPGVTVDKCPQCDGLWFDIEEVYKYASHKNPSVSFIPTDDHFKLHTSGPKEKCPCCEERALETGSLSGYSFRRCAWCGGIFIERDKFRPLMKNRRADEIKPEIGDEIGDAVFIGWGILELISEILFD